MRPPLLIITRGAVKRMEGAQESIGRLGVLHNAADDLWVIKAVGDGEQGLLPVQIPPEQFALTSGVSNISGQWTRTTPQMHVEHQALWRRPTTAIKFADFKRLYPQLVDPGARTAIVVTYAPDVSDEEVAHGIPKVVAWLVTRDGVAPCPAEVEPAVHGLEQLRGHWPLDALSAASVLVVGAGSIGGSVAQRLAGYGVGSLHLLDPDRLLWHNTVRHVLGQRYIGRHKVDALKDDLTARWPDLNVTAHVLDVVVHADLVRPLLDTINIVVCAADGVRARRVVSHLAQRARRTALLACVLDNGGIGEILRLRPRKEHGCLMCRRAALTAAGGIDPEPDQDAVYGTGEVHRPMTAVGPDLDLVGALTAKMTVATLLETRGGEHDQRLPGEHAIVALRPKFGRALPYDLAEAGDIRWLPATPPRPECPTCSPA